MDMSAEEEEEAEMPAELAGQTAEKEKEEAEVPDSEELAGQTAGNIFEATRAHTEEAEEYESPPVKTEQTVDDDNATCLVTAEEIDLQIAAAAYCMAMAAKAEGDVG